MSTQPGYCSFPSEESRPEQWGLCGRRRASGRGGPRWPAGHSGRSSFRGDAPTSAGTCNPLHCLLSSSTVSSPVSSPADGVYSWLALWLLTDSPKRHFSITSTRIERCRAECRSSPTPLAPVLSGKSFARTAAVLLTNLALWGASLLHSTCSISCKKR